MIVYCSVRINFRSSCDTCNKAYVGYTWLPVTSVISVRTFEFELQLTLYYLSSYQLQLLNTTFQCEHFTIIHLCSYFLNHNVQSNFQDFK